MTSLYTQGTIICKLWEQFSKVFREETAPTRKHLFDLVLSILDLNGFMSVKFNYEHFISEVSDFQLKSYYFTLNESKIELSDWMERMLEIGLSMIPKEGEQQAVILSIDDTMVEKFGKKFEHYTKLFDHAAHNGSNYLNGHCFVSLLLSVPVSDNSGRGYLSFPIAYRMWTKDHSKIEMAAELVRSAMETLGKERQVILCCDSWYPKAQINQLVNEYENLVLIASVRKDTGLYDLPPKPTGKKGRPRIRGNRLCLEDFQLKEIPGTDFFASTRPVVTDLFGRRTVFALVTRPKKGGNLRLFLCTTDPMLLDFDLTFAGNTSSVAFARADQSLLPLSIYAFRWGIEVSFYEQKSFWALEDYMLRSKNGIERLLNLLTIVYSFMKLLPYLSSDFSALKPLSAQQARFLLGKLVRQQVFLTGFDSCVNSRNIRLPLTDYLLLHASMLSVVA